MLLREVPRFIQIDKLSQNPNVTLWKAQPIDPIPNLSSDFVVLKISKDLAGRSHLQSQLLQQIQYLGIPNVIVWYGSFNTTYHHNLILEYYPYGSLKQQIKNRRRKNRPFSLKQLLHYMHQLARAVYDLHENQIVHRDIKPGNIMISNSGGLKLSNFSAGKKYKNERQDQTLIGTYSYMSPEKIKHLNRQMDRISPLKADIWGLGRTFAQMAICQISVKMNQMEQEEIDNLLYTKARHYSEQVIQIIQSMLRKDLEERPLIGLVISRIQLLMNLNFGSQIIDRNPPNSEIIHLLNQLCIECQKQVEKKVSVSCNCIWHLNCLVQFLGAQILVVNSLQEVHCRCSKPISLRFISELEFQGRIRQKFQLLYLKNSEVACSNCKNSLDDKMVNQNYQPYNVTCKICNFRFCSFCGHPKGHRKCKSFSKQINRIN